MFLMMLSIKSKRWMLTESLYICNDAKSRLKNKGNTYSIISGNKCSRYSSYANKNAYRNRKSLNFSGTIHPSYWFSRGFRHNNRKSSPKEPTVNNKCWGEMSCQPVRAYSWFRIFWCWFLVMKERQKNKLPADFSIANAQKSLSSKPLLIIK